jgi:hypothetical protein
LRRLTVLPKEPQERRQVRSLPQELLLEQAPKLPQGQERLQPPGRELPC